MKKLFTFLLSVCFCAMAMAQSVRPEAVIAKATVKPKIDGVIDDLWATVEKHNVNLPFKLEKPTLGADGTTYWKGLWDADGMYIIVVANDDYWDPYFLLSTGNSYEFDMVELYFDTNYTLADAKGGQGGTTGNRQIAPNPAVGKVDGQLLTTAVQGADVQYAINANDAPLWICEYFVPWDAIPDGTGVLFDKTATMGFDVDITDRDPSMTTRNRALWSNDGTRGVADENWNNMDEAGHLTFDGAQALIYVDAITIGGGTAITTDGGTLQLTTAVTPADATNQKMKWTITNGTGKATISSTGLVTPILNGTVTVKAAALDGGWAEASPVEITISGQVLTKNSKWNTLNLFTNWNFNTDVTNWSGWWDGVTQIPPAVQDGVVVCATDVNADGNNWHYQFNQSNLTAEPNIPYTFAFKSWSTTNRTNVVDFEDTSTNSYNRYGVSTDPTSNGRSEWKFDTTSDPTWYTFHVTFDQIIPTTVQKIQWELSTANSTVYLDSVLLIKDADLALTSAVNKLTNPGSFKVYQLNNVLTVDQMASTITNVAIYNALGQKMMEKAPNGTMAKFNVNSLREGVYFVRLSDGSSQKFMK